MTDWSTFSLGNAAGFVKRPGREFDDLLRSAASIITIGSITFDARAGNTGNVYWHGQDGTSVNALGLPNPGLNATLDFIAPMRERANAAGKKLHVSIAGEKSDEYRKLARALRRDVDGIEVNLGCPNVWGTNGQKPIASFEPSLVASILTEVWLEVRRDGPAFLAKLSPYSDPMLLKKVARAIREVHDGEGLKIVLSNTFPNGLAFREGRFKALDQPYGGVGGAAMRNIALGQVAQFAAELDSTDIEIIGVGGVSSGADLAAMREAGAAGVQIGTAFGERGARVFSDVLAEAAEFAE